MAMLVELCPDCHGDEWLLVEDDRVCVQCRAAMELTEIPGDFYCPCGCDGIADLCVYAATCPDCGHKFIGGSGYGDTNTQCNDCKQKAGKQ